MELDPCMEECPVCGEIYTPSTDTADCPHYLKPEEKESLKQEVIKNKVARQVGNILSSLGF